MLVYSLNCSLSTILSTPFPPSMLVSSVYSSSPSSSFLLSPSLHSGNCLKFTSCSAKSRENDQAPDYTPKPSKNLSSKPSKRLKSDIHQSKLPLRENEDSKDEFLKAPRKPRHGRKSEAVAVEDFVRDSLERAIASLREWNSDVTDDIPNILKERVDDHTSSHNDNETESDESRKEDSDQKSMAVDEDDPSWPLDADVGLGIRASEYFEKHPIKNVIGNDGVEIDWEGEIDEGLVKEINCLEWERFAFHPSPLIVLVFERYNRASENWKVLKELEKAAKVYWRAKDRLPPRTIKIDINIERDLAYALHATECPQILFLRGNRILYREKEFRSADELVQMIAHFYYNARKPSCIQNAAKSTR